MFFFFSSIFVFLLRREFKVLETCFCFVLFWKPRTTVHHKNVCIRSHFNSSKLQLLFPVFLKVISENWNPILFLVFSGNFQPQNWSFISLVFEPAENANFCGLNFVCNRQRSRGNWWLCNRLTCIVVTLNVFNAYTLSSMAVVYGSVTQCRHGVH